MVDFKSFVPWRNQEQTPVSRDDFFDPFVSFRREVDRIFDAFFEGAGDRRSPALWHGLTPVLDVEESDKELVVSAELPGVSEKDVEVTLSGDLLTIKGEKRADHEEKDGNRSYIERRYGSFSRSVRLPFEVKDEAVNANYDKGVLTIKIPKPEEAKKVVRRIEVKAA